MNQRWKYHYKKYVAIALSAIASALMVTSFLIGFFSDPASIKGLSGLTSIWNYAVFSIIYLLILIGNIQGSYRAYNGVLGFVFMFVFQAIFDFLLDVPSEIASLSGQSPWLNLVSFLLLAFYVFSIVSGIMTYVRIRQYLIGRYSSYRGVRNWCLGFTICTCLSSGFLPLLSMLEGVPFNAIVYLFLPISEFIMSIAIYFTVLRLKSEY